MSRTDKDKPAWVLAEWWEASHTRRYFWQDPGPVCRGCDLPAEPRVMNLRATIGQWASRGCHWEPVHPYRYGRRAVFAPHGVPKWFIDHIWNGPERRRERDDLRALREEYNANGYIEDYDFPCWQARRSAHWLWD